MSCVQTIMDYGLRSIGIGERLLPRADYNLCQQATLIGSGLIWNLYFAVLALSVGFVIATLAGLRLGGALTVPIALFIVVLAGVVEWFFARRDP